MKKYSALIILKHAGEDDVLDEKLEMIRAEITKQGGSVEHITRMGRQAFARRMNKRDAGLYVLATFSLMAEAVATLRDRFNQNDDIFRIQITVAPAAKAPAAAEAPA